MKILFALIFACTGLTAAAGENVLEKSTGVYWVPVKSTSEARYAVFSLPEIDVRRSAEEIRIAYPLPRELTGALNFIELEGRIEKPTGPLKLEGPLGFGECPSAAQLNSCEIHYRNLKIDPRERSDLLKRISRSPTELELREKIAAAFCLASQGGGEPCGFLTVGY